MKGIILAGGHGTRLHPLTLAVSKQLLPIYDKPMIYYPLSVLMLAGIREILIISTPRDLPLFQQLFGTGAQFGLELSYVVQPKPEGLAQAFILGESFIGSDDVCMILGDNIFYGAGFYDLLQSAMNSVTQDRQAAIFGYYVEDAKRYGVATLDEAGQVIGIEEKPAEPKSNYAVVGLYFYPNEVIKVAKGIKPSKRGELEITDINQYFIQQQRLTMRTMSRGYAWLDTGTHESLTEATEFVKTIEKRTGLKIACLEEIALVQGWVSKAQITAHIAHLQGDYYDYIRQRLLKA